MTSQSHKKLQTIPQNTHRLTSANRWAILGGMVVLWSSLAATPACSEGDQPFRTPDQLRNAQSNTNPLDALKQRSAQRRWDERQLQMRTAQADRTQSDPDSSATQPADDFRQPGRFLDDPLSVQIPQVPEPSDDVVAREPVRSPSQLKPITSILPFSDYEPDADVRSEDPCRYLCPRPDGEPCTHGDNDPECPEEVSLSEGVFEGRDVTGTIFSWEASNLYHNPLYFEDPSLERYGHTHHDLVQPFVSAGKFGVQLIGLPYQMTIDPIHRKMYTLGWYRPGECAPYKHYQVPLNAKAAAVQAGAVTGAFFLFP